MRRYNQIKSIEQVNRFTAAHAAIFNIGVFENFLQGKTFCNTIAQKHHITGINGKPGKQAVPGMNKINTYFIGVRLLLRNPPVNKNRNHGKVNNEHEKKQGLILHRPAK